MLPKLKANNQLAAVFRIQSVQRPALQCVKPQIKCRIKDTISL